MKVAVTGAGGFLGRELVHDLSNAGYSVLAFTSQEFAPSRHGSGEIDYARREEISSPERLRGVDVLINCAFPRQASGADLAPGLDYIRAVFEAARDASVGAVVNVSSQSVYDNGRDGPADERSPLVLDSPYAVAKFSTELLLSTTFPRSRSIDLRLSSLIGPGFDARLVNKMIARARRTGRIRVVGGRQEFDFMDVNDAARALRRIIAEQLWTEVDVLNVGNNRADNLLGIATVVATEVEYALGCNVEVDVENAKTTNSSSSLDCSRFFALTNFEPTRSLSDSVKAILQQQLRDDARS